jgi:uncharacterized protein YlaN (UPF0358 family)
MRAKWNVPCYIASVVSLFPRIPLELFYMPGCPCYEDFLDYRVSNLRLGCYTDFICDFFIVTGGSPKRTVE